MNYNIEQIKKYFNKEKEEEKIGGGYENSWDLNNTTILVTVICSFILCMSIISLYLFIDGKSTKKYNKLYNNLIECAKIYPPKERYQFYI